MTKLCLDQYKRQNNYLHFMLISMHADKNKKPRGPVMVFGREVYGAKQF